MLPPIAVNKRRGGARSADLHGKILLARFRVADDRLLGMRTNTQAWVMKKIAAPFFCV